MSNQKKIIFNNLIVLVVLIIAALVGGFFGSYFTYRLDNFSIEKRNKVITKQVMLFIHNEIYKNYIIMTKLNLYSGTILLSVDGLELINLRAGNLTIKDEQLSFLIRMYVHFSVLNSKMNEWKETTLREPEFIKDAIFKDINEWLNICLQEIEGYEKEFCKDKSLKFEIEVE